MDRSHGISLLLATSAWFHSRGGPQAIFRRTKPPRPFCQQRRSGFLPQDQAFVIHCARPSWKRLPIKEKNAVCWSYETFPNPYICTVILQKSARCCLFRLLSQRTRQCWGKGVPGHVTSLRAASLVSQSSSWPYVHGKPHRVFELSTDFSPPPSNIEISKQIWAALLSLKVMWRPANLGGDAMQMCPSQICMLGSMQQSHVKFWLA